MGLFKKENVILAKLMKIRFLITLLFACTLTNSFGQIVVDSVNGKMPLVNNENVKVLRTNAKMTFQGITESANWKHYDSTYTVNQDSAIWLSFEVENHSGDTIHNYLFSDVHYIEIYQQTDSQLEKYKNGSFVPLSERSNTREDNFTKLSFAPFQKSVVFVRLYSNWEFNEMSFPSLLDELEYWKESSTLLKNQTGSIWFVYFYIISLGTILIFALVFWVRLRDKLYLYYLGYLFFQLIYGFIVLRKTSLSDGSVFEYFPKLAIALNEPIQFIFIGFYILFILHLLTIKEYDNQLAKVLRYFGLICFIYAIFYFVLGYFLFDKILISEIAKTVRLIIFPINILLILWIIYRVRHPLLPYFIVGQGFFFIGALLASYFGYSERVSIPPFFEKLIEDPNIVFQIGLLLEVYCFSFAIGKNVFLLREEKEKTDSQLIDQLQKNHSLQLEMNRNLDKKVNEKTAELIQLYSKLEKEQEIKIKTEFTQKLKETEMVVLRSQMNPHFIFNSLSAIKNLIMTLKNDEAIVYLDDFSRLLREILQSSYRKKITVEEELEIIELYLSLEQKRMGIGFNYDFEYSSRSELSQYEIPPLILQPIVENAIWHGLQPSLKAQKNLKITFDTKDNLKIIIEDNGIGRKASSEKKKLNNSMGIQIVQDRLTLYNHLNAKSIFLKTTDLEKDGDVLGTRITLIYQI